MAGFSRILVPTDFSDPSGAALGHARVIADRFDATLHLLHIVEAPSETGPYALNVYAPSPAAALQVAVRNAEAKLRGLLRHTGHHEAVTAVLAGRAPQAILDYAAQQGIDLIVIGTHGRTGLAHLFLGSVAEHVVRAASCPVLTVRRPPTAFPVRTSRSGSAPDPG